MKKITKVPIENKDTFISLLIAHRSQIKAFGVKRLGLFGSFGRDQQTRNSDLDILVEFEPGKKSFDNFIHLSFYLQDLVQRKVDLVTPESLSPYIGPHILREAIYVTLDP